MLELDLILDRFVESRLDSLTADQREALARLLELPDNDLLDVVMGRTEPGDPGCAEIAQFLR